MNIVLNVTSLTQEEASDYRQDLIRALHNPGTDYEFDDVDSETQYRAQLQEVDKYLVTFPEKI
jgi:hypothetical protein